MWAVGRAHVPSDYSACDADYEAEHTERPPVHHRLTERETSREEKSGRDGSLAVPLCETKTPPQARAADGTHPFGIGLPVEPLLHVHYPKQFAG